LKTRICEDERSVYATGSWHVQDCPCPIAAISGAPEYDDYIDEYGEVFEYSDCETRKDDIASGLRITTDELDELVTLYDDMGAEWLSMEYDISYYPGKNDRLGNKLPADVAKGLVVTALELCAAGEIT